MGYNKIILSGNVGSSPKFIEKDDIKLVVFPLAVRDISDRGETQWFNVKSYENHLIEIIRNTVVKGSKVLVDGKLIQSSYLAENGEEKKTIEIKLNRLSQIIVLDSPKSKQKEEENSTLENN